MTGTDAQQHTHFDNLADYQRAIVTAIKQAKKEILMCEESFSECDLGSKAVYDALWAFFSQPIPGKLKLIAFKPEYLAQGCPRFIQLRERFTHLLEMRASSNPDQVSQGFILIDGQHYVLRHHFDWPKGEFGTDGQQTAALQHMFYEIWEYSESALEWQRLGL